MVTSMPNAILKKIYRFPIKGFPGQELDATQLNAGFGIPHDRRFAITKSAAYKGEWMASSLFYINAVTDGMSKHQLKMEDDIISITNTEGMTLAFDMNDAESLQQANNQIEKFIKPVGLVDHAPPPQIVDSYDTTPLWDFPDTQISFININTVKAISEALGEELDPLRFRGNLLVDGIPAWQEFSWMGKRIKLGETELEISSPIKRCPTPGVNPATGERDINVTQGIQDHFGHIYCGIYANVVKAGDISTGDKVEIIGDAELRWQEGCGPENARKYPLWPRLVEITSYQVGEATTQIALKSAGPWPLPAAQTGQRIRLHIGQDQVAVEYIVDVSSKYYHLDVTDSQTDDPVTTYLRNGSSRGQQVLISGPFGRA